MDKRALGSSGLEVSAIGLGCMTMTGGYSTTPDRRDMITLHGDPAGKLQPGKSAGIAHFGFNLAGDSTLDAAVVEMEAEGGSLVSRGEHGPGSGYAYVADPDGYVIEL